jgi:TonB family protein
LANLGEEEEHEGRKGSLLFALLVLLAIGVVLGVRYRDRILPLISQQGPSVASQPSPQTESGQSQATPQTDAGQAPAQSQPQPAPAESQKAGTGETAPQSAAPQAAPTAEKPAQPAPESQTPAAATQAKTPPAPEPEKEQPAPTEEAQAPRVMNAEGAVMKRVLPSVAPGAVQSMQRPVQVNVRVSVNASGNVSNARFVTQGQGNYFARIARQAAQSWKFKPPISGGRPRESEWTLLFQFDRRHTDVIATELH